MWMRYVMSETSAMNVYADVSYSHVHNPMTRHTIYLYLYRYVSSRVHNPMTRHRNHMFVYIYVSKTIMHMGRRHVIHMSMRHVMSDTNAINICADVSYSYVHNPMTSHRMHISLYIHVNNTYVNKTHHTYVNAYVNEVCHEWDECYERIRRCVLFTCA